MRQRITSTAYAVALVALLLAPMSASAQRATRINDDQVKSIISRLESAADAYRSRLDAALDDSQINGTKKEDRANKLVQRFEESTDRLKGRFDDDNAATGAARAVLENAAKIDKFMQRNGLDEAAGAWSDVRDVLDDLALAYNVAWTWDGAPVAVDRVSDKQVDSLLERVETRADQFRSSLDQALDQSEVNGTAAEDEINRFVQDFEAATDKWKSHFGDKSTAARDAEEVLARAQSIDGFMASHRLTERAHADWAELKTVLEDLAAAYNVTWDW